MLEQTLRELDAVEEAIDNFDAKLQQAEASHDQNSAARYKRRIDALYEKLEFIRSQAKQQTEKELLQLKIQLKDSGRFFSSSFPTALCRMCEIMLMVLRCV
jgi:hypothetical protein